ncbi:MAG: SDR family NAD(P)-dependent oxidoreductase [Spirochaetales bacterium]|nr:SDR family NAD(P)-dependent oxidoreductase [Spirochaetales bacterium]
MSVDNSNSTEKMLDRVLGKGLGLLGKTAVITGGAVNIGASISIKFASIGVKTVIIYNSSDEKALKLEKEITASGGVCGIFKADLSCEKEVVELFQKIKNDERFGRVDILVNNSGIFTLSQQTDLSEEDWQKLFGINMTGTFLCCREAVKLMKEQSDLSGEDCQGCIINTASINALHPGFGQTAHYDASKGAVYSYTKSLAAEIGGLGIRVNSISPGLVDSKSLRSGSAPLAEMVEQRNPLKLKDGKSTLVQPENVADAVVFLASNMAKAITGENIVIDRGYLLS